MLNKDLMSKRGRLKGWRIKLDPSGLGFDLNSSSTYPNGYCIPLSNDTPEFRSFYLYDQARHGFSGVRVDEYPQFRYIGYYQLLADKGIIYRADNPSIIYPAIGYDPKHRYEEGILHSFHPIFLNNGESIEEATSKEYTIIYDPEQSWKPKNKLTIQVVDYEYSENTESNVWHYEYGMYLPLYTTPLDIDSTPVLKNGNSYEVALTGDAFGFYLTNLHKVYSTENCEQIDYKNQYYVLFKVLDMTKDVKVSISFYDPAA